MYDAENVELKFFRLRRDLNLTWAFNWSGVYANYGWNVVKQQHQTLKAVTDGKLLTLDVLGQQLILLES